jgi:hypothetical protein
MKLTTRASTCRKSSTNGSSEIVSAAYAAVAAANTPLAAVAPSTFQHEMDLEISFIGFALLCWRAPGGHFKLTKTFSRSRSL